MFLLHTLYVILVCQFRQDPFRRTSCFKTWHLQHMLPLSAHNIAQDNHQAYSEVFKSLPDSVPMSPRPAGKYPIFSSHILMQKNYSKVIVIGFLYLLPRRCLFSTDDPPTSSKPQSYQVPKNPSWAHRSCFNKAFTFRVSTKLLR